MKHQCLRPPPPLSQLPSLTNIQPNSSYDALQLIFAVWKDSNHFSKKLINLLGRIYEAPC